MYFLYRIIRQTRNGAACGPLIPRETHWDAAHLPQAKKLPIAFQPLPNAFCLNWLAEMKGERVKEVA